MRGHPVGTRRPPEVLAAVDGGRPNKALNLTSAAWPAWSGARRLAPVFGRQGAGRARVKPIGRVNVASLSASAAIGLIMFLGSRLIQCGGPMVIAVLMLLATAGGVVEGRDVVSADDRILDVAVREWVQRKVAEPSAEFCLSVYARTYGEPMMSDWLARRLQQRYPSATINAACRRPMPFVEVGPIVHRSNQKGVVVVAGPPDGNGPDNLYVRKNRFGRWTATVMCCKE